MAESAIVWSGQQDIKMGPGATPDWLPSLGWLLLDMNGDGSTDLRFDYVMDFTVQAQSGSDVTVIPQPPYSILDAAPIAAGSVIASGSTWGSGAYPLVDWESIPGVGLMGAGSWAFVSNGYMGVSFTAADGIHYGWVQVSSYNTMGAHINSWAYESQPGVSIMAGVVPEPSTIGLILLGSGVVGLAVWRRQHKAVSVTGK